MIKILLLKQVFKCVFVLARKIKLLIFWQLYFSLVVYRTMKWINWYKENTYCCY